VALEHIKLDLITTQKQIFKFAIVGFFTTILNYAFFYTLYDIFKANYLISAAIGFIVGVAAGFLLNKNWTFSSKKNIKSEIYYYFSVYTFTLIIGLSTLKFLVSNLNQDPKLANISAIAITSIINFIGIKTMVFKR